MTPRNDSVGPTGAPSPDPLVVLKQVDSVCDAFEASWQTGVRPRIDSYLQDTNLPTSTLFVELVQIDVDYRRRNGELPTLAEYAEEYPDYGALLQEIGAETSATDNTVAVPAPPAARLGRFELVRQLGTGTFSIVWQAWDPTTEQWVAIKELRDGVVPGNRRLLEREARAVGQLNHPNVVRVLDVGEEHETSDYLVFEFIDGENLKDWILGRGGEPVEPRRAAEIVWQVALGLDHIHRQVIIHRDIKPGNILLTKAGVPKVADFGLARHVDAASTISSPEWLMGTIPYMSPEQTRAWTVDATTDIYSLGVILYEMLAGHRPFAGTESELIAQIRHREPPPLDRALACPPDLERICRRALEKAPADRYQTASDLAADLERFLKGEKPSSRPIPYRKFARTLLSRRSFIASTIGAPIAGVAGMSLLNRRPPADGLMGVTVETKPPGAKVTFIPLSDTTGQPNAQSKVSAGISPAPVRLKPGDYLVIAELQDGSGRFHEVYRHVPVNPRATPGPFKHVVWKDLGDSVALPSIVIPPASVTETMALVDGMERFTLSGSPRETLPPVDVPSFFVDTHEFTIGEYKRMVREGFGPDDPRSLQNRFQPAEGDDRPKNLTFEEALARAEYLGKRLLHPLEFELILTARGRSRYPWGTDLPERELTEPNPGPVGTPAFDRFLSHGVAICGLGSNVAEWVDGDSLGVPKLRSFTGFPEGVDLERRHVRGGNFEVFQPTADPQSRIPNPRLRTMAQRWKIYPGIGFRCARSLRPRLTESDFARISPLAQPEPPVQ